MRSKRHIISSAKGWIPVALAAPAVWRGMWCIRVAGRSSVMPRPTTRLVAAIAVLLGLVMLSASVAPPAIARAPGNDKFSNATKIGSLPYHKSQNTRKARLQDSDPLPSCQTVGHTVWFKLKRGSDTAIVADTVGSTNTDTGDYDTVLVAYEQTGSGTEGLVEVACNDDSFSTHESEITFTANANTTYYVMVGSYSTTDGGDLKFNVRLGG
jgi:hypothetical protein